MIRRMLVGIALVVGVLVATQGPALAAMPSNAPKSYVTIWNGLGYSGAAYPISDDWTGCRAIPTAFNDMNVSVANNSATPARNIRFYNRGGCDPAQGSWIIYAGTYSGALNAVDGKQTWSSYRFGS